MKNNKNLLSIIIPVYNTEHFLEKCLKSILCQSYKQLEIIVVDDASPGKCNEIVSLYAEGDKRIRYIRHEENRGLFQARITGVVESKGDFFAFVDSDDHVSIDYYRLMVKKALETSSDIVIGDFVNEFEDGRCEYYNLDPIRIQDLDLQGNQVLESFMKQQGKCYTWHVVWNKIYTRSLWNKCSSLLIEFANKSQHLIMTEDIAFSCTFWSFAERVTNIHNAYYYYVKHSEQSINNSTILKFTKNINDVVLVFEYFKSVLKLNGNFEKFEDDYSEWRCLFTRYWANYAVGLQNVKEREQAKKMAITLFNLKELQFGLSSDDFFYKFATQMQTEFSWYEAIKKSILDPKIQYVSFDIFETLLLRPFLEPEDLFVMLSMAFNEYNNSSAYIDFAQIRREADKSVRHLLRREKPAFEDVTLDEIYQEIATQYALDMDVLMRTKNKEIELETRLCYPRKSGKELFELAMHCNKQIILISDMYLPYDIVVQMLQKCRYMEYDKLYLSSEERLLKATGSLYKKVLHDLNVLPQFVMHTGDNWNVDMVIAKEAGIRAFSLPKTSEHFKNLNPSIYNGEAFVKTFLTKGQIYSNEKALQYLGVSCMLGVVANKIYDNPFTNPFNHDSDFNADPRFIGYYALGMHLYAVADWLLKETSAAKKDVIHFVARDGFLVQKAYDIMRNAYVGAPESNYLYTSRKATFALQCPKEEDMYSIANAHNIFSLSPQKIAHYLKPIISVDASKLIEQNCKAYGFFYTQNFKSYAEYINFIKLIVEQFYDKKLIANYFDNMKEYFGSIIGDNDVLFDLGYSARNELMFSKLLDKKIESYFIHINSDAALIRERMGNVKLHTFYDYVPTAFVVVREHLFCEQAPSCIGYNVTENMVAPEFEEYKKNPQSYFVTTLIQNSALEFVSDFKRIFEGYESSLTYTRFSASLPYEFFLHYAKKFDRDIFSESIFEDDLCGGRNIVFTEFWEKFMEQNNLGTNSVAEVVNNKEYFQQPQQLQQSLPEELQGIYMDGLFISLYHKLNKWFPQGGKGRERVKKLASFFFRK